MEVTEATVEDIEAMVDTATAGATTESVRLMPSLRLLPSPTTATEDMEATGATVDMVLATAGATTASVRPRPSPTTAMEGTVVDTEATVDTATAGATMASASNLFPGSS